MIIRRRLDSSGPGQGHGAGCRENGNENYGSLKFRETALSCHESVRETEGKSFVNA
jgi:hypothetical protein